MKRHPRAKFDIETEKQICELYLSSNKYGCPALARLFNCNWATIRNILIAYKIPLRDFSSSQKGLQLGSAHPSYKGGNISPSGHRRISVGGKIVFEHRFLKEQELGRKLSNNEVVHHINHDKLDNRLENLMVMTRREHILHHFEEIQPKAIEAARQRAKDRRDTLSQMEIQNEN